MVLGLRTSYAIKVNLVQNYVKKLNWLANQHDHLVSMATLLAATMESLYSESLMSLLSSRYSAANDPAFLKIASGARNNRIADGAS